MPTAGRADYNGTTEHRSRRFARSSARNRVGAVCEEWCRPEDNGTVGEDGDAHRYIPNATSTATTSTTHGRLTNTDNPLSDLDRAAITAATILANTRVYPGSTSNNITATATATIIATAVTAIDIVIRCSGRAVAQHHGDATVCVEERGTHSRPAVERFGEAA
jgi:hypothetical protein